MTELWKYFECQRCGQCCKASGLPWDPLRTQEIADFLKVSKNDLIERYYGEFSPDGKSFVFKEEKRKPCPFLQSEKEKKSCTIYPVRPLGCRLYPFETDGGRGGVDCPAAKVVYDKLEALEINQTTKAL